MKTARSYISSLIICILLVFTLIASIGVITAESFAAKDNLIEITEENNITEVVRKELERHFTEKYADTGIPANVYMENISDEYIRMAVYDKIDMGFAVLQGGNDKKWSGIPENTALDEALTTYFAEYAESIDYEISDENDPYYSKLANARKNAKHSIEEYSDVFKFNAIIKHGVLDKARPFYNKLSFIKIISLGASAFLALLLLICNFKRFGDSLYWLGTAALSVAALGGIPCIYLLATNYFSSFTVKQAQVYTVYTASMRGFTQNLLIAFAILAGAAVLLYIMYALISRQSSKKN